MTQAAADAGPLAVLLAVYAAGLFVGLVLGVSLVLAAMQDD